MVEEVHGFAESIKRLPLRTRELLTVVVERGHTYGYVRDQWAALFDDVVEATRLGAGEITKHLGILERYGIGYGEEDEERYFIVLPKAESGWPIWKDLAKFFRETEVPAREILVELRFELLD